MNNDRHLWGRLFTVLVIAVVLSACASSLPAPDEVPAEVLREPLPATPEEGEAMVYVIRSDSFAGSALRSRLYLDEESPEHEVGSVRVNEYVHFPVRLASQKVLVSRGREITIAPEESDLLFLYLDMNMGFWTSNFELTPVEEAVGRQLMHKARGAGDIADQEELRARIRNHPEVLASALAKLPEEERPSEIETLVLPDNTGKYLSPYTSDAVTAEWINQAINVRTGEAAGSAVGAAAGNVLAGQVLDNVPFGGMLGGMVGSRAGGAVGRDVAIDMDHVRETSDRSFRSVDDMARYLVHRFGDDANFADVVQATELVYPGFQQAVVRAARSPGS